MAEPTAFPPDAPGWDLLDWLPCERCEGRGEISVLAELGLSVSVGCPACNGWGKHYLRPPLPDTPGEPPPVEPDAAADLVDAIGDAAEQALRKLGLRGDSKS